MLPHKLKFVADEPTHKKLQKHCNATSDEFTVAARNTAGLEAFIGLDCIVRVKLRKYSFTSAYEHNKGQKVEGFQLVLLDIARCY